MSAADTSKFPPERAAIIAVAIALFMLIFRPFGMSIGNGASLLAVLGFAPLNFVAMALAHMAPPRAGWFGAILRIGGIVLANIAYVLMIAGGDAGMSSIVKVVLIALLVIATVGFWNRERALHREVLELRNRPTATAQETFTLRGDNDSEILRLTPSALLYLCANGNYVDVHFVKNGAPEKSMLRATLAGLRAQTPDGVLVQSHRSYLVNLDVAQRLVSASGRMEIEFPNGAKAPVSRSYKQAIRAAATS